MAYPKTYERALEMIKDQAKDKAIVDLGCGEGDVVKGLRKHGFTNIKYADIHDRFDGNVDIMDFSEKLKYKDNSFDIVMMTEVINCIENPNFLFREIKRILKKEGILVISFPNLLNIPNKLTYFFGNRFIDIVKGYFDAFFIWQIPKYFQKEKVAYNRGFIPVIRIPFFNGKLFGQSTIVKCRLKKDVRDKMKWDKRE